MNQSLPKDIFLEYYLNLDIPTLSHYCQVDSKARDICNSEYFWRKKLQRDFPYKTYPLNREMARQIYIDAYHDRQKKLTERFRSQRESEEEHDFETLLQHRWSNYLGSIAVLPLDQAKKELNKYSKGQLLNFIRGYQIDPRDQPIEAKTRDELIEILLNEIKPQVDEQGYIIERYPSQFRRRMMW